MISRRLFVGMGFGGLSSLSGCGSIDNENRDFYCDASMATYNLGLCGQLKIMGIVQRISATLSMLFGARNDAEISKVMVRQAQLEAKLETQGQLLTAYVLNRKSQPVVERVTNVVVNVQSDQKLCVATLQDLEGYKLRLEKPNKPLHEQLDLDKITPLITEAARKNIGALLDGATGYDKVGNIDPVLNSDEIKRNNDEFSKKVRKASDTLRFISG